MIELLQLTLHIMASLFKPRAKLVVEILVRRQQLNVLRRQVSKRPRLSNADRIRSKNSSQVRLAKDQYPIEALASHGADQTLHIRILPRRSWRDRSVADAHSPHPGREDMSVGFVIVAHQIGRRRCPGEGLGYLSGQPLRCRMSRHLEPQQLPAAEPEMQTSAQRSGSEPHTDQW